MIDIKGYEGLYAITSCGKVWSHRRQKFLKPYVNGHDYLSVKLVDENGKMKTKRVNRLVAEAYIPNPEGKRDVEHIDSNRQNNNINNLRWATRKENCNNEINFRNVSRNKTKIICVETGEIYESQTDAAKSTGIGRYNINNVITGKQKTAGGYHWERYYEKETN